MISNMTPTPGADIPEYLDQFKRYQEEFEREWHRNPIEAIHKVVIDTTLPADSIGVRFQDHSLGVSAIISTNVKNRSILKYAAAMSFLTEDFRNHRMIHGLIAFYTLLQTQTSAMKSFTTEFFQDYVVAYERLFEYTHPRFESEIRAFVGLIPLKDMFNEFIMGLWAHISPEEFLYMVIQYLQKKLNSGIHLSEPILHQLVLGITNSPMKVNYFEENEILRKFFAIPIPVKPFYRKIGLSNFIIRIIEPLKIQLRIPSVMLGQTKINSHSKAQCLTITAPDRNQINSIFNRYKSQQIVSDYRIVDNTQDQFFSIANISIPNYAVTNSDIDRIELGLLDFLILNIFEHTTVKDYLTPADFLEQFVRLTENKLISENKRLKKALALYSKGKNPQSALESILGYKYPASAQGHIKEYLEFILQSIDQITREQILKRASVLLEKNYLRYGLHANFMELLVSNPQLWHITIFSPNSISDLLPNHFLFLHRLDNTYNIIGDFIGKIGSKLAMVLAVPVEIMETFDYYVINPLFYLRYDYLKEQWADYINYVQIEADSPQKAIKKWEHTSFPNYAKQDFNAILPKLEAIPLYPSLQSKKAAPLIEELWLNYTSEQGSITELCQQLLPAYSIPQNSIRPRYVCHEKVIVLVHAAHYYLNPHFAASPIKELLAVSSDFYYFGGYLNNFLLMEFNESRDYVSELIQQLRHLEKTHEFHFEIWVQKEEKRILNPTLLFSPIFQVESYSYLRFPKSLAPTLSTRRFSRDFHELLQAAGYCGSFMLVIQNYPPLEPQLTEFIESLELCKAYTLESEKKGTLARQDMLLLIPVRNFQHFIPVIWELLDRWKIMDHCIFSPMFNRTDFGWL
jgi:hypothetical protein